MKNHFLQKPFAFFLLFFFFFGNVGFVLSAEQDSLQNQMNAIEVQIEQIERYNQGTAYEANKLPELRKQKKELQQQQQQRTLENIKKISEGLEKKCTSGELDQGACTKMKKDINSCFSGDFKSCDSLSQKNINQMIIEGAKTKIDLFAPFSISGDDIFCRVPKSKDAKQCPTGFKNTTGDGNVCYKQHKPGDSCEYYLLEGSDSKSTKKTAEGQIVQRIIIEGSQQDRTMDIFNRYVGMIFVYGLGLGAGFSVLMIVVGGIQTIVTGSSPESVSAGKDRILQGVVGIGLLLLAAAILYTVNPLFFTIKGS